MELWLRIMKRFPGPFLAILVFSYLSAFFLYFSPSFSLSARGAASPSYDATELDAAGNDKRPPNAENVIAKGIAKDIAKNINTRDITAEDKLTEGKITTEKSSQLGEVRLIWATDHGDPSLITDRSHAPIQLYQSVYPRRYGSSLTSPASSAGSPSILHKWLAQESYLFLKNSARSSALLAPISFLLISIEAEPTKVSNSSPWDPYYPGSQKNCL